MCTADLPRLHAMPRPVVALAHEYEVDALDPVHVHARGQLLYGCTGVMTVVTDEGRFVVPPQRALWLPAGVRHEVHCRGAVSVRTLYVDADASARLPPRCRVIEMTSLLRALLMEAVHLPLDYDVRGRAGRIMQLALDEIASMRVLPLSIPMPRDARLARVCRAILEKPAPDRSLEELAGDAGLSRHTLTRIFRRETGMGFSAWRQHVVLLEAVSRLHAGESVTSVALSVGYESPSAFSAMFRRVFGATPREYVSAGEEFVREVPLRLRSSRSS